MASVRHLLNESYLHFGCQSMFIPVDDDSTGWEQSVWRIEKDEEGKVTRKKLFGVRYVPLTDAPKR